MGKKPKTDSEEPSGFRISPDPGTVAGVKLHSLTGEEPEADLIDRPAADPVRVTRNDFRHSVKNIPV